MSEEKTGFLESQYYPVVFMLVLSVVFVGVLSVFYRSTEKGIEEYRRQTYQLQIMSLFADTLATVTGKDAASFTNPADIQTNFSEYVREQQSSLKDKSVIGETYYLITDGTDTALGICYDIRGSGLWGTMRGLLALTSDQRSIINFAIYDQMETPGLGSRVEEDWFKKQFAGKPFGIGTQSVSFSLVPEDASASEKEIRQVTGATITSASVLKMIQEAAIQLDGERLEMDK